VEEEKEEHAERMQGNRLLSQNCSINPLAKETEVVPEIMGFLSGYYSITELLQTQYSLLHILHAIVVFIQYLNCSLQVQVLCASQTPRK
jgi:hypothetical protein